MEGEKVERERERVAREREREGVMRGRAGEKGRDERDGLEDGRGTKFVWVPLLIQENCSNYEYLSSELPL